MPRKPRSDIGKKRTKPYNKGEMRKRSPPHIVRAHTRGGPLGQVRPPIETEVVKQMRLYHNGRDITEELKKVTIQEGTQRSDVTILKLFYIDKKVDTKVMLPFPLKDNYVILRKRDVKVDEWERLLEIEREKK